MVASPLTSAAVGKIHNIEHKLKYQRENTKRETTLFYNQLFGLSLPTLKILVHVQTQWSFSQNFE